MKKTILVLACIIFFGLGYYLGFSRRANERLVGQEVGIQLTIESVSPELEQKILEVIENHLRESRLILDKEYRQCG